MAVRVCLNYLQQIVYFTYLEACLSTTVLYAYEVQS
jgi:hypothetical protein